LCASQLYLADIVCSAVKGRVYVDEVYFPPEPVDQQGGEDFFVVPVEEQVDLVLV